MLTLVLTKSMLDQAQIFLCIRCNSFQINLPIAVYHFGHIDRGDLDFVFQSILNSFAMFIVSICDVFHC